jgi:hypothetical protein
MDGQENLSGTKREKEIEKIVTEKARMRPKRYIVWSTNKEIDLNDPWQRKWYIGEVLANGRAEDIAELDWEEVRRLLPELNLPRRVRRLWEDYFEYAKG